MHICYVDESGGFEAPDTPIPGVTPAMVILGVVLPARLVPTLTRDFLTLKRAHFPGRFRTGHGLSHILREIKGTEILQRTRSSRRDLRRHASRVRADVLTLLERHDIKLIGRVWVKEPNKGMDPVASYCFAIQDIARHFSTYLVEQGTDGVMICDAREQKQNTAAAHSVFTDKFRTGEDPIPAMIETPVFSHSDNHAGLQVADLVATTMLLPMAAHAYCSTTARDAHASPRYADVRTQVGARLRALQHMYRDENGRVHGGIVVSDKISGKSSAEMFRAP